MDNAELRRGKPTSHKVFGETMALLSGDALLTFAFETIASNAYASKDIIVTAVAEIAKAAGTCGMVGGQVMDTCSSGEFDFDTLLKLHSLKTGALIKAAACLGCLAANVDINDERMADALCYAENIGLAFQITDDILDLDGDVNMTGKNSGSDKRENKTTFMTFCSSTQARQYAKDLTDAAIDAIEKYEGNENLVSLARYLLVRNK
jgi:geranylgeranyl pyrophosphate synthase